MENARTLPVSHDENALDERSAAESRNDIAHPEPVHLKTRSVQARGQENPVATGLSSGAAQPARKGRGVLRAFLMLAGIAAAIVGAGAMWLRGGRVISTDNAYVRAAKLMVSTDVSGIVSSVEVKEGERVKAGQVLFRVDAQQFEIALRIAEAQLEQTKINLQASQQDYQRLLNDISAQEAQTNLARTISDRAAALLASNAGTRAAFDQAHFTLIASQKQLEAMRGQARAALTRLGGGADLPVEQLPQYLVAKAQTDEARRQLEHTIVRAPFAGIVTAVDHLQPGTFLVSQTAALTNTGAVGLIATDDVWIDANVKETDLTEAKIGDPVEVSVDAYPNRVWRGRVASIAPSSGSEFSILPAQNAGGNWVKVVQRVPVRIAIEPEPDAPVLRAGMSAIVEIDTGHVRTLPELWGGARTETSPIHATRGK